MKICFSVEQCKYALFECSQYVYEISKKHTEAVSGECVLAKVVFYGVCYVLITGAGNKFIYSNNLNAS